MMSTNEILEFIKISPWKVEHDGNSYIIITEDESFHIANNIEKEDVANYIVRIHNESIAFVRKPIEIEDRIIYINDIEFDTENSILGGKKIKGKLNKLLRFLYVNRNEVILKSKILRAIWGMETHQTVRSLDVFIRMLRIELGDETITTIPKVGYKLNVE